MSVNLNLKTIAFHDDLVSAPVRENFADTESAINDLQAQIDGINSPEVKVSIDTCEALTGWSAGGDAGLSLAVSPVHEGAGSIQFDKTAGTQNLFMATRGGLSLILDGKKITAWVYISDQTTADNLNTVNSYMDIGSGGGYKRKHLGAVGQQFFPGWNEIVLDWSYPDASYGSIPAGMLVDYVNLEFNSQNTGDTFIGKIFVDDIYYGPNDDAEVRSARDTFDTLRERLRSGFKGILKAQISGGVVSETTVPSMAVKITAGECIVSGVGVKWGAMTSGTITAPATNPRWDTVVVNSAGNVEIVAGTESATPVLPSLGSSQKKQAHIYLTAGMTEIVDADIRDARVEKYSADFMDPGEPVGTIKAWHKNAPGTPALSEFWKECDGTLIDDPESPYYGLLTDDLNGGGRHLEGATTSGTLLASQNKAHDHTLTNTVDGEGIITVGGSGGQVDIAGASTPSVHKMYTSPIVTMGTDGGTDSRPKSMTVVWIMRIK